MTLLAFFSDVHANLAALQAVLADIQSQGADQSYCLGDLIGYGPDPNGVVDLVRAENVPTIMGNYDDGVAFERGGAAASTRMTRPSALEPSPMSSPRGR